MSRTYTEFGTVENSDRIHAKRSDDGERVFIPKGYEGYEENDPRWMAVAEAVVGDGVMTGEVVDIDSGGLNEASLSKEKAIENVQAEFDDIETAEQTEALIEYLASEVSVEDESGDGVAPFELEDGQVKLFDGDFDTLVTNRNHVELFNCVAVVSATISALGEYLEEADEIAEQMEDLMSEVEVEELFDANNKLEDAKSELKQVGESEGFPTPEEYRRLSDGEQQLVEQLTEEVQMYSYIDDIDPGLVDNLDSFDYGRYHDFLKDAKTLFERTNAQVLNTAQEVKAKENALGDDTDPVEIQQNLRSSIQRIRSDGKEAAVTHETMSESRGDTAEETLARLTKNANEKDADFENEGTQVDREELGLTQE